MRESFLDLLACPDCAASLAIGSVSERAGDAIVAGELVCRGCARCFPIEGRIPRFVAGPTYTDSFGWQWKRWAKLQRDSYNGSHLVENTIFKRSGWSPGELAGTTVVECGCGAGNDSEVLARHVGRLVSVDLSASVEAFDPTLLARANVLVLRADVQHLPLARGRFDLVYCHRMIMHTPDPPATFGALAPFVRPGGRMFLHCYDTHWKSKLHFRYWMRPLLVPVPTAWIFRGLRLMGPPLWALAGALNRVAFLRRPTKLFVPFENHDRILEKAGARLGLRERYEYGFLVTFDALTPAHDHPEPPDEVERWFRQAGMEVEIRSRNPVIALGRRPVLAQ